MGQPKMPATYAKKSFERTIPVIPNSDQPDFSVCVKTDAGWIFLAEFRTFQEATSLAEATLKRSAIHTCIRRFGETVAEFEPTAEGS